MRRLFMSTQKILVQLYESVIVKLELALIDFDIVFKKEKEVLMRFADELKLDVPDPESPEDRDHTARIALMPVVQKCVVAILRELINICKRYREPQIEIPAQRLFDPICARDAFDWETFPQSVGLEKDQAEFAVRTTAEVLLETNLFESPVTLTMDGEEYEICHAGDGFSIRRIGSH